MAKPIQKPKGTRDFFPQDLALWQRVETTFREYAARYGYGEIRTPLFEDLALFQRSIGEQTDIVGKELYVLETGGGKLALRPEQTASIVRAYLENGLHKSAPFSKFYYLGPQFRHERQQKNRYRQFDQLGVEALGSRDPALDAEVIDLAVNFLKGVGLDGVTVRLNTLGRPETLEKYRAALREALTPHKDDLCRDDQKRLDKNVLRVLDSKDKRLGELLPSLPKISDYLSDEDEKHFQSTRAALEARGIDYEPDPTLVRGFDYYTGPVFEIFYRSFGTQDAIGAGGRYDGLVEQLGGPATPCVGFALGTDRIVNALEGDTSGASKKTLGKEREIDVFVVNADYPHPEHVAMVVGALRDAGYRVDCDREGKSAKAQTKIAKRRKARVSVTLEYDANVDNLSVYVTNLKSWDRPWISRVEPQRAPLPWQMRDYVEPLFETLQKLFPDLDTPEVRVSIGTHGIP